MDELKSRQCIPCEGGVEPLSTARILHELEQLPGWQPGSDGKSILRRFSFRNFHDTMAFINALADVAEQQGHHPDFCAGYNYCEVRYTTHAINGLSINDLICAARINELPQS